MRTTSAAAACRSCCASTRTHGQRSRLRSTTTRRSLSARSVLRGGFVWEWIDHGSARRREREYFAHGGDFGEPLHDGNFVADGLLFPDRTPSPGLIELKKVFEPVRITGAGAGEVLRVENRFTFRSLASLAFSWVLEDEGARVAEGSLHVGSLPAGAVAELPWPKELPHVTGEAAADSPRSACGRRAVGAGGARGGVGAGAGGPVGLRWSCVSGSRRSRSAGRSCSARARSIRSRECWRGSGRWTSSVRGWTCGARRPTTTRATTGQTNLPRSGARRVLTACGIARSR